MQCHQCTCSLFMNIVHKLLLNTLIRTEKLDGWGATAILKDKVLKTTLKLT